MRLRFPLIPPVIPSFVSQAKPKASYLSQWRPFVTAVHDSTSSEPKDIAVLGGGVTGLATTYYLSERFPNVPIHLYEAGSRLGGWVQSERVDVDDGSVLLEQGPRNLRPSLPNGLLTLDLADRVGIASDIITTPSTSPAAKNRFIYYPDHLVKLPGSVKELFQQWLREPLFKGAVLGAVRVFRGSPPRPAQIEDESVADFAGRLFSPAFAVNILSAVFHGIYAGDIHQLSARSLMGRPYHIDRARGSVVKEMIREAYIAFRSGEVPGMNAQDSILASELKSRNIQSKFKVNDMSVFSFRDGIETFTKALEKSVRGRKNVRISLKTPTSVLTPAESPSKSIEIKTPIRTHKHSHAVCTVPGYKLREVFGEKAPTEQLSSTVTVMVVNMFYRNPDLLPVQGFGYLLPQSLALEQNPEFALGVVFDSCSTAAQDTATGQKLTVMLGGHWWNGWTEYPTEEEAIVMAKCVLARHLEIQEEPAVAKATLQRNCIPQYLVGHRKAISELDRYLFRTYSPRLKLAGSTFGGVGLNDSVRSAYDAADLLEKSFCIVKPPHNWD